MDIMGIMQILNVLVFLYLCCDIVNSQTIAPECFNNKTCPCCTVPCPSDGSGQCDGNCKDGFYGLKCLNRCPYNCIRCVDTREIGGVIKCTLCKDGYFSTATLHQCQSNCSSKCKTCSKNDFHCDSCNTGFYLTDSLQCSKCKESCLTCTDENTCTACKVGYYNNGTCQKCDPLCYACNSSETCLCSNGCFSGGQEERKVCNFENKACYFGCRTNFSSATNSKTCAGCIYGNYGYECNLTCNNNCSPGSCDRKTGACFSCVKNVFGDFCNLSCPINCKDNCYQTSGHCLECKDGFFGTTCTLQCSDNCRTCIIPNGTCMLCKDGWYGENCDQACFKNCQLGTCNHINGNCTCAQGYRGPRCEDQILTTVTLQYVVTEEPNRHVGPTVGGTLAGVIVIGSVAVAVLVLYRRRRAFKYVRYDIDFDSYKLDARLIDVLEENDEFDPTYFTGKVNDTKKPCGKLPVKELAQFVNTHGEDFYQEEFLKLPRGLIKPCDDAKKEENVVKNRYTGIYPYDEHRVRLQPPGSDFINACYMDGYKRKHEYIASLGPTRKAMEGFQLFWRMVWQEKTDVIVMVTNLMEGQSMKCEQYWPDIGTSAAYGEITLTSQTEDVYAEFVVRSLAVTKGREERMLHHFHYTAWPDKRVPDDVTSLIEFRQKVNATGSKLGGPTIVHCSAGIGRTGTYIALDILIHQGKAQKSLDIFEWVTRMREQRTSMVQTWPQYEYLHRALLHALTYRCEPVKQNKIELFMERLNDKRLAGLFKQLDRKHEKAPEGEQEAKDMNKGLDGMNREGADIPGSMHRPFLHLDKLFGENNYINAVFLNSYTVRDHFLVCQTPLPDTVKDFLTLIIQESCSCIVSMDPPGLKDPTIGKYYPEKAGTMFSHPSYVFDVEAQDLDTNTSYKLRRLTIHFNKRSGASSRTLYHFQCQHWPQGNRVPDVSHFLQLVQDVGNMAERDSDRGPVLVHCLNAAERSGLFCAISNLVQKMRVEGEVSVVNTLRQVKVRRPTAIPNKDQYVFCYRCLHQFVKSQSVNNEESLYGNI